MRLNSTRRGREWPWRLVAAAFVVSAGATVDAVGAVIPNQAVVGPEEREALNNSFPSLGGPQLPFHSFSLQRFPNAVALWPSESSAAIPPSDMAHLVYAESGPLTLPEPPARPSLMHVAALDGDLRTVIRLAADDGPQAGFDWAVVDWKGLGEAKGTDADGDANEGGRAISASVGSIAWATCSGPISA